MEPGDTQLTLVNVSSTVPQSHLLSTKYSSCFLPEVKTNIPSDPHGVDESRTLDESSIPGKAHSDMWLNVRPLAGEGTMKGDRQVLSLQSTRPQA